MRLYVQTIDKSADSAGLKKADYTCALSRVNYCITGNRVELLPLFKGMRVRLTEKLNAQEKLVDEEAGTVVGFQFDEREFSDGESSWRTSDEHIA
jgi:hypothetical protein